MSNTSPPTQGAGFGDCLDCELYGEVLGENVSLGHGVDSGARIHDYQYGGVLYQAAAPVDAVYFIRSGIVKMVKAGPAGEQRIVRVLKTGDIAEIESIISDTFEHTAIAVGTVRACRIPVELFRKHVAGSAQIQLRVLQKSLTDLREAESWFSQLTGNAASARTRMARLLLCLRVDAGDRIHRLGIADMAAIVGINPVTVSRIISEFRRQEFLSKGGLHATAQRYFRANVAALENIAREMPKNPCSDLRDVAN